MATGRTLQGQIQIVDDLFAGGGKKIEGIDMKWFKGSFMSGVKYISQVGDVVQIDPESDPIFGGHFMVVTDPKPWGAQGYCEAFPQKDKDGVLHKGQAYYRCKTENMVYIGKAEWMAG